MHAASYLDTACGDAFRDAIMCDGPRSGELCGEMPGFCDSNGELSAEHLGLDAAGRALKARDCGACGCASRTVATEVFTTQLWSQLYHKLLSSIQLGPPTNVSAQPTEPGLRLRCDARGAAAHQWPPRHTPASSRGSVSHC